MRLTARRSSSYGETSAYRLELGGDAAMKGEKLLVQDAGQREAIEAVDEGLVELGAVLAFALLLEVEEGGHLHRLVVAP